MVRRLRLRRSFWAAIAAGILAAPLLMGGATATPPSDAGDLLPPPEPDPRETLPPDPIEIQARLTLAQANAIADLAPEEFRSPVVAAASRFGLDPRILAAIITVETEWNPRAVGLHGERGLMQILPSTGEYLARKAGLTEYDLADSATNLALGASYIASLLEEYGDLQTALAAYNGGPTAAEHAADNIYARKVLRKYRAQARYRTTMVEAAS
jgi:soluble lytic murein transglycosylase-like protein